MSLKKIYLTSGIILFICGMITAFENIALPAAGLMILFKTYLGDTMLFTPILIIFLMGMASGALLMMGYYTKEEKKVIEV